MGALREHGSRLVELGYEIVPIDAGTKRCTRPGWQNFRAKEEDVQKWLANGSADAGVGIIARNTIAIDVDVVDEGLSKTIAKHIRTTYGARMLRVGKYPKYCIPFRVETPFSKISSSKFEDLEGRTHQVEILGDGQYFVALGTHPDTQKEYVWKGAQLLEVEQKNLPTITRDQCLEIITYFETLASEKPDWTLKTRGNIGIVEAPGLESLKAKVDKDLQQLHLILDTLGESVPYDQWIRIGQALHHQTDGAFEGLRTWDEWSSTINDYNSGECQAKWESFGNFKGVPVTAAYILYLGKVVESEANKRVIEKDNHVENWHFVQVEGKARVVRDEMWSDDKGVTMYGIDDLKKEFLNRQTMEMVGDKQKLVNPVDTWLSHSDRLTHAKGLSFYPDDKAPADTYNLWQGFSYPAVEGPVDRWLEYLLEVVANGSKEHGDYILSWCAHLIQKPTDKPGVALVFRGEKGTGKSFFGETLGGLFKPHFIAASKENNVIGRFNKHILHTLLLQAEEAVFAGSKIAEGILKDLITNPYLTIEGKNENAFSARNHTRLIFTSNEDWVVPASKAERRFAVFDVSSAKIQNHEYFDTLRKWYNNGGASHILHYLMNYDIRDFNVRVVPDTDALSAQKLQTFDALEQWLYYALEEDDLSDQDTGIGNYKFGDVIPKSELYTFYKGSVVSKYESILTPAIFWKRLYQYPGLIDYESRKKVNNKNIRTVRLVGIGAARRIFGEVHKINPNWSLDLELEEDEETPPF